MFRLTTEEFENLRCQVGTSKSKAGGRRYLPLVFTESEVAMLSSVLSSERACLVNVSIIRTFVRLRSFLAMDSSVNDKINKLEQGTNRLFKVVFERLDTIEDDITPKLAPNRKKIGIKNEKS